jgi:murein DD-endopeptidase MepM/ murein hydrolase activator NlpD
MARLIKRALSDLSVRETIPTEDPEVGQRHSLDLSQNLKVDPSVSSTFLNPEVFDALSEMSKDIHDTRRSSRTKDLQKEIIDEDVEAAHLNYLNVLTQKNEADSVLTNLKINSLSKLENYREQAKNGKITEQDVLNLFLEDVKNLQYENSKIGNYYIAEELLKWGQNTFDREYSSAVIRDYERSEKKVEASLYANTTVAAYNIASGKVNLDSALSEVIKARKNTFGNISNPEGHIKAKADAQVLYEAEYERIKWLAQMGHYTTAQFMSKVDELFAKYMPTGEPFNESKIPSIRDTEGNLIKQEEGLFGTYYHGVRQLNDAEKIVIDKMSPEEIEKAGFEVVRDDEGKAVAIKETIDVSMDQKTYDKILNDAKKYKNTDKLHYSLAAKDTFIKATGWNDIIEGKNWLQNPYLISGTLDGMWRDIARLEADLNPIIMNGTPEQQATAIAFLRDVKIKLPAAMAVMEDIRAFLSTSTTEELSTFVTSRKSLIGTALKNGEAFGRLEEGDLQLIANNEETGIDTFLGVKENQLDPNYDKGMQRYAYAKELYGMYDKALAEISSNPGKLAFTDRNVSMQSDRVDDFTSPHNLITLSDNGINFNVPNIGQAEQEFKQGMNLAYGAAGRPGIKEFISATSDGTFSKYKSSSGEYRQAYSSALSKIVGPDFLSMGGNFVNKSKEQQAFIDEVGMYTILNHSSRNSHFAKRIMEERQQGLFDPTPDNINSLTDSRKITLKNQPRNSLSAADAIDRVILNLGIKPEYIKAARLVGYNLIMDAYLNKQDTFDMKTFEDVLSESFSGGEYIHANVYTTKNNNTPVGNSVQSYVLMKDDINKDLQDKSVTKGSQMHMDPVSSNMSIRRFDNTDIELYNKNGNKEKFIIYNQQAPGVSTDSVKTAIGDIAVLANNVYDMTNPLNPVVYTDRFYEKYGTSKEIATEEAIALLTILNDKNFQLEVQHLEQNPNTYDIEPDKTSNIDRLLASGKGYEKALTYTNSEDTTRRMKILQLARAWYSNPNKVSVALPSNPVYTGKTKEYKVGDSIRLTSTDPSTWTLSSPFGPRPNPISGKPEFHTGVDIATGENDQVKSRYGGVIVKAGNDNDGYGNKVIVKDDQGNTHLYGHLNKISGTIKVGGRVGPEQLLGYSGSTGKSTGPHIHYEVRNPQGKAIPPFSITSYVSGTGGETPIKESENIKRHVMSNIRRQDYNISYKEIDYVNDVTKGIKIDKDDAFICGRPLGTYSKNNPTVLDAKSKYHTAVANNYEYVLLRDKVFNDRNMALAAMYPGVTFSFRSARASVPGLKAMTAKQILVKYKKGELKDLMNVGYWAPDNIDLFDTALRKYKETP